MSWAGILERIQFDAIDLLSNPNDANKLDRKYVLALASLLDEQIAFQVLSNRKDNGWCSNWLCQSTKNHKDAIDKLKSQFQEMQQDDGGKQDNNSPSSSSDNNNSKRVTNNQTLVILKYSFCCTEKCKGTLKVLLQRARDFDPSTPEVAQSLFKIFPNAESGVNGFLGTNNNNNKNETSSSSSSPSSISKNNNGNNDSKAAATSNFTIIEKNIAGDGKYTKPTGPHSTNLVYSALDPRISVVVLADLLLPSALKQKWTMMVSILHHPEKAHPAQRDLFNKWISKAFLSRNNNNNNNNNNDNIIFESLFKKCDTFADQNPNLLNDIQRQQDEKRQTYLNNAGTQTNNNDASAVKEHSNRLRARSMAYDILSSLLHQESKRAALLLRLETEMPSEFREKIEEFLNDAALPSPIPYEDSKDTWLLFVIMLFVVSAISDPRFGAVFLESSAGSIGDIFESFCISQERSKEILEAFFAV